MREDGLPEAEWSNYRINQIVPEDIAPAAATMMITWRETLSYIMRLGVARGSRVLVLGSGGNGNAFVAHAANLGAERVAFTGSAAREESARQIGATDYYNYKDESLIESMGRDHPDGFDVIVDAVGKEGAMTAALPLLKSGGVIGDLRAGRLEHVVLQALSGARHIHLL
jgi:uncharacterized zinc-type alcohol dehydrogenase-like protein